MGLMLMMEINYGKILVVDDSKTDRLIVKNMLSDYQVITAADGIEALEMLDFHQDIDLLILDLDMPRMNGFELLERMKVNPEYSKVRTIILTNYDEIDNEVRGLSLGAVDYIRKPLNIESLRIRIDIHLRLKNAQKLIESDNERLDGMVAQKTAELVTVRDVTIHALVGLLEVRNIESGNHTVRTQKMMKALCNHLKTKKEYRELLTDTYIKEIVATTPLHDIGKVGIPDHILLKPGKLTQDEFTIMKKHVDYGITALKDEIHGDEEIPSFIKTAISIIGNHHERYNGNGYPKGLKGKEIPLEGRLMGIIDVYDALMNKRVYKPSFEFSETINIMEKEKGEHFDPEILEAFFEIKEEIAEISIKYNQEFENREVL